MAGKRKAASRKSAARRPRTRKAPAKRRVATRTKPAARILKRTAPRRRRRKISPYQSAVSAITYYLNRGGRSLPRAAKKVLNQAKTELSRLYARR